MQRPEKRPPLDRLLAAPELPTEERRKRVHIAFGLMLFIPIFLALGFEDLRSGRQQEAAILVGIALYLASFLAALPHLRNFIPGLRFAALLIVLLLVYEIWVGGGGGFAILWFYCFPAFIITLLGLREGTLWAVSCLGLAAVLFLSPIGTTEDRTVLRFLVTFAMVVLFSYVLESSRQQVYGRLQDKKSALEEALDQVKTLRGLLPFCTQCKNVRDDQGYWQEIEKYVAEHSEAGFTHGMCDRCVQEFYSDVPKGADSPE